MKYYIRTFSLTIFGVIFHTTIYSQNLFEKNYRQRCDSVIDYFCAPKAYYGLFSVMAKYASGKADTTTAESLSLILKLPMGNMFRMYSETGVYFYGRKNLSSKQKQEIITAFAHYNADTGITENHKLMYYGSLYLISGEDEKDTVHWFNHKTSSDNSKFSANMLKTWMNKAFSKGFAEFNSPHYGGFYLAPLLMLYDFSKDKEIKAHAEILLWRILGNYLIHYHNSVIAGASSRVVDEDIFNKKNSEMAECMGLFLGDRPLYKNYHTLFFALSSFRFPEILSNVWNEGQKQPFAETDIERSMDKINSIENKNEGITTSLYSDSLFSLGSIIEGHNDEIQTRTWSLDWKGNGNNTSLFGLNPFMSKTALAAYFPGNIDTVYKNILKQRPFYNDTNKWIGGSPFENLFQYKNVLLGIYNFPDTLKNNSVSFFISDDIDSLKLENTILYAKTGSIYFALRFSSIPEISNAEHGKRYRIKGRFPAFAIGVYPANEYKLLNDFRRAMNQEKVGLLLREVSYDGNNGVQMKLSSNGDKTLNQKPFALPSDTIYKSPFINISRGIMTIKTSEETAILNWDKQEIMYLKNH